jgi:hypothetical protein
VNVYRRAAARRGRAAAIALLLGALLALAVPAWAAAAVFTVTGTGDTGTRTACETKVGECTLRGALEAANTAASEDEISFGPSFGGGAGSTIAVGSPLSVTQPVKIIGSDCAGRPCVTLQRVGGTAVSIQGTHATLEGLAIELANTGIGIQILNGQGVKVVGNTVKVTGEGTSAAIESNGSVGGAGNLIEGNKISVAFGFNFGIALQNGPNLIFGNEIEGSGCCFAGVWLELSANGNQIGGDTEASENLITGYSGDAIHSTSGSLHNEVGRNHGQNGGQFIPAGPTPSPTITGAYRSSVSGTGEPGATIRVFRKATEEPGEIESFLGEDEADSVTGAWKVSFANVPIGTFAAATQTLSGSTSSLGGSATLGKSPAEEQEEKEAAEKAAAEKAAKEKEAAEKAAAEKAAKEKAAKEKEAAEKATKERQEIEAQEQRDKEAKEKEGSSGGGGSTGGGSTGGSSSPAPAPTSPPPPAVAKVAPKVKITAGPRKTSSATTARFRFKATNTSGARFECKLDGAKWARCASPKTYRGLKPGRHTFRVRATAGGLTGAAVRYQFTVQA